MLELYKEDDFVSKKTYCPYCGTGQFPNAVICTHCRNRMKPFESIYDSGYYSQKAIELYNDVTKWQDVLREEASENPLFDKKFVEYQWTDKDYQDVFNAINKKTQPQPNEPKCPTCQSTNIKTISIAKKAIHSIMFGIFSKTVFSQFECENCGYKW